MLDFGYGQTAVPPLIGADEHGVDWAGFRFFDGQEGNTNAVVLLYIEVHSSSICVECRA